MRNKFSPYELSRLNLKYTIEELAVIEKFQTEFPFLIF